MTAAVTESMKERTGRSLDEWVSVVEGSGVDPLDQKAVRSRLKETHGVLLNSQWAIAFAAPEKAGWVRPDVEGRGGYTPFVRRRQFAAVAAATRTRMDLGLRFTDAPSSDLLKESKGPGRSTHKIGLTSPDEVTPELRHCSGRRTTRTADQRSVTETGFDARPVDSSTTRNLFLPSLPLSTQVSNPPPRTVAETGKSTHRPS